MPCFPPQKGLYTLRLKQFRFAYELTDQSIIISAIIRPSMLQQQTSMFELASLMNQTLPHLIEALFKMRPTRSIKTLSEDKTESFITINIPINNNPDSDTSDSNELDTAQLNINSIHEILLNTPNQAVDNFDTRWLGFIEPSVGPTPQPTM